MAAVLHTQFKREEFLKYSCKLAFFSPFYLFEKKYQVGTFLNDLNRDIDTQSCAHRKQ